MAEYNANWTGGVPLMEYFRLIRTGIDVAGLLGEVRSQEEAWLLNCDLSRATIVRLKPYSRVFRHIDEGYVGVPGIDFYSVTGARSKEWTASPRWCGSKSARIPPPSIRP